MADSSIKASTAAAFEPLNVWERVRDVLASLRQLLSSATAGLAPSSQLERIDLSIPGVAVSTSSTSSGGVLSASKHFLAAHRRDLLVLLSRLLALSVPTLIGYFMLKWLMQHMDPTHGDKLEAKLKATRILQRLGIDSTRVQLNEYELLIAANIVLPQDIDCDWRDIGGLEHIIDDLRQTVIMPLRNFAPTADSHSSPQTRRAVADIVQRRSRLIQPPKGVLLFGPPGNAKTMIAKALAKDSQARFINLPVSSLFDKWFGESQKRTEAVFSLAHKVQPVIIFIDEIDSFLRSRRSDDHECTSTIKTQFMALWDGLMTVQHADNRVLIVGATNRPEDIDAAILRRMPQKFYIGLPNESQRRKILGVILRDESLDADVKLDAIAAHTADFSGSDLHELCRCAAMNCFIRTIKSVDEQQQQQQSSLSSSVAPPSSQRLEDENAEATEEQQQEIAIGRADFEVAFEKMRSKKLLDLVTNVC